MPTQGSRTWCEVERRARCAPRQSPCCPAPAVMPRRRCRTNVVGHWTGDCRSTLTVEPDRTFRSVRLSAHQVCRGLLALLFLNPTLSLAPIPYALDPHTVERAWVLASRWSAPLYERPGLRSLTTQSELLETAGQCGIREHPGTQATSLLCLSGSGGGFAICGAQVAARGQRRRTSRAMSSRAPLLTPRCASRASARRSGPWRAWRASASVRRCRPASMSSPRRSMRPSV